jgi:hypothetical protein
MKGQNRKRRKILDEFFSPISGFRMQYTKYATATSATMIGTFNARTYAYRLSGAIAEDSEYIRPHIKPQGGGYPIPEKVP